jgi:hypothetical protein
MCLVFYQCVTVAGQHNLQGLVLDFGYFNLDFGKHYNPGLMFAGKSILSIDIIVST